MQLVMAFRGDSCGTAILGGNRLIFGSVLIANWASLSGVLVVGWVVATASLVGGVVYDFLYENWIDNVCLYLLLRLRV